MESSRPLCTPTERKTIVIVGATGVLGGAVARRFGERSEYRVRAVSRDPESDAAQALRRDVPGIEIVCGDLDDEDSLYAAFRDAECIFTRTHYWLIRRSPETEAAAKERGIGVDTVAMEHERQQWANTFHALARAVWDQKAVGKVVLETLIVSALPNSRRVSQGKYKHAYHFESKADGISQLREGAKNHLPGFQEVLDRTSYLYVGAYLESFFNKSYLSVENGRHLLGPSKLPNGSFSFCHVAVPPFHRIPIILPRTDMGPLVEALAVCAPPRTHLMGGQPMTLAEFSRIWGKSLQVDVQWKAIGVEDMVSQMPTAFQDFARTAVEASAFVTEYGFDGGIGARWPSEIGVSKAEMVDVAQWVRDSDWSAWL